MPDPATKSRAVPIYQTTSYVFHDTEHAANLFALKELGNIYTRIMNPTQDVFEKRMAALEGGVGALATAPARRPTPIPFSTSPRPGMKSSRPAPLRRHIQPVLPHLPKMGITVKFVDQSDPENFRRAITDRTKAIFAETIGNPASAMCSDIEAVANSRP